MLHQSTAIKIPDLQEEKHAKQPVQFHQKKCAEGNANSSSAKPILVKCKFKRVDRDHREHQTDPAFLGDQPLN